MAQEHYPPAQVTAIKTEIRTGLTFVSIALGSSDPEKTARNTGYATLAYENARAWTERTPLSPEDAKEIGKQLEHLKAELAKLTSKHPARS